MTKLFIVLSLLFSFSLNINATSLSNSASRKEKPKKIFPDLKKQKSGSYFKKATVGKGLLINEGMLVFGHQIVKTQNDSILFDYRESYQQGPQIYFEMVKPFYKGDVIDLMKDAHVGDSLIMGLRVDSFFAKPDPRPIPSFLNANGYIRIEMKIDSAWSAAKFQEFKVKAEEEERMRAFEDSVAAEMAAAAAYENCNNEPNLVKELAVKYKTASVPTESGLYIASIKKGTGDKVKEGDEVSVHYTGYFPNGEVFDSSVERNEPFILNAGVGQVIPAWDEALLTMSVGDKIVIVAPSSICYGTEGTPGGPIEPCTPLVFEIELLKIENKK